jgi:hypothetical protein
LHDSPWCFVGFCLSDVCINFIFVFPR